MVPRLDDGVLVQMHRSYQIVDHLSITAESGKKKFLAVLTECFIDGLPGLSSVLWSRSNLDRLRLPAPVPAKKSGSGRLHNTANHRSEFQFS